MHIPIGTIVFAILIVLGIAGYQEAKRAERK